MSELRQKHKELLDWAERRSLHIDPRLGRDEPPEQKRARTLSQRLKSNLRGYDDEVDEGEPESELKWYADMINDNAAALSKLRSRLGKG